MAFIEECILEDAMQSLKSVPSYVDLHAGYLDDYLRKSPDFQLGVLAGRVSVEKRFEQLTKDYKKLATTIAIQNEAIELMKKTIELQDKTIKAQTATLEANSTVLEKFGDIFGN